MILNRKDLNNLVQPLTSQVEFHLNTPFLLFKKLSDDIEDAILGIWFVDTGECIRLTEKIQSILREVSGRCEEKGSNPEGASSRGLILESKASGPGQNILSLLSNAQKTYDQEHGASYEHTDPRPIKHASGDASGMSQISLADLFRTVNQHTAKAGMVDTGTDTSKHPVYARSLSVTEVEAQRMETKPTQDNRHPLLKLISSKTVEEIEKQHIEEHKRLKGGGGMPPEVSSSSGHGGRSPGASSEAGIDLMQLLRQGRSKQPVKTPSNEGDSGDKGGTLTQDGVSAVKKLISMQDPQFGTNRGFIPVSLPSHAHSVNEIESSLGINSFPAMPDAPLAEDLIGGRRRDNSGSSIFPSMLKPSDLDPSLARPKSPPAGNTAFTPSVTALLTPQAFLDRPFQDSLLTMVTPPPSASTSSALPSSGLNPLNRDQLQQAMIHLIKNDSNFLNTIHAAYLESFNAATGNKS
ncbi:unnamed protein product [Lymnaea stagnalis]|uniref:mRNA-decapping enzyme C-terminal domain-containing protein n=1 Tax=Lymnaea stagnalis TaxID=6523 RepID=A0AAV2IM45_LYMST